MMQENAAAANEPPRLAHWLDHYASMPMFVLSILYLAVASGVIHRIGHGYFTYFEVHLVAWSLVALWPIFTADAVCRFVVTRAHMSFGTRLSLLVGVLLFPWLRLGLRTYTDSSKMWLPWLGVRPVDRALRRRLERYFSVPMVLFALMVLPVLVAEYYWEPMIREHFWLAFSIDVATSIIWVAFVLEFTLMVSVAEHRISYCIQNWMDLAVVILPIIDFLPVLRLVQLSRLVQLNQVGRLSRLYRLRGLLIKAWRAVLLLEMLNRLLGNYQARRLKKLKDQAAAKQLELDELRQEISELERAIQQEAEAKAGEAPQSEKEGKAAE